MLILFCWWWVDVTFQKEYLPFKEDIHWGIGDEEVQELLSEFFCRVKEVCVSTLILLSVSLMSGVILFWQYTLLVFLYHPYLCICVVDWIFHQRYPSFLWQGFDIFNWWFHWCCCQIAGWNTWTLKQPLWAENRWYWYVLFSYIVQRTFGNIHYHHICYSIHGSALKGVKYLLTTCSCSPFSPLSPLIFETQLSFKMNAADYIKFQSPMPLQHCLNKSQCAELCSSLLSLKPLCCMIFNT
jgi:hypothetical protein